MRRPDSQTFEGIKIKAFVVLMVFSGGCDPERNLRYQFESESLRLETTELRGFVYDTSGRDLNCEIFNPVGQVAGDAIARTNLEPDHQFRSAINEVDISVESLDTKRQLVVLEAWKNQIVDRKTQSTLLSYVCKIFDFTEERTSYLVILDSLEPLGSTMKVRQKSEEYTKAAPLILSNGVNSRNSFDVQLLDRIKQNVVDHPVHFTIKAGSAFFENGETNIVVQTDDDGVARTFIDAGQFAYSTNEGLIEVEANAPGFQGGPVVFFAQVLPSFRAKISRIPIDRREHNLGEVLTTLPLYPNYQPFIAVDLDGNGRTDFVTASGLTDHKLYMFYRDENGGMEIQTTPAQRGIALSLISAQIRPNAPKSLLVSTAVRSNSAPNPRLYSWSNSGKTPGSLGYSWTVTSTLMDWAAIAMSSYDLDQDGADEVGMVRCALPFGGPSCRGGTRGNPDNQIAVMQNDGDGNFSTRSKLYIENSGGFRKLLFTDLNQDDNPDIVTTMADSIGVFCGNSSQFNYGFTNSSAFKVQAALGQVSPLAIGNINKDRYPDLVFVGGYTDSGANSKLGYLSGCPTPSNSENCPSLLPFEVSCGLRAGPKPVEIGTRSFAGYQQELHVVDLNGDGADDGISLHRTEGKLYTYFGGLNDNFGVGPDIKLPVTRVSEMALYEEDGVPHVAMFDPDEHALIIVRIEPN